MHHQRFSLEIKKVLVESSQTLRKILTQEKQYIIQVQKN